MGKIKLKKKGDNMNEKDYFENLTDRERAIFEGGISMGALYHQFVGTPINLDSVDSLEKAIKESIMLQPAIVDVDVNLNKDMIKSSCSSFGYTSLEGNMLEIELTTQINDTVIKTCISYDENLNYPIMYIKD